MGYFRQRARAMTGGFVTGFVVGWFQPMISGIAVPELSTRLFLSLQTGAAFMVVTLVVLNYLEIRRRVFAKLMKKS